MGTAVDNTQGLPIGTRLGEFEITQRIGDGGFSIVYLAWDHSLERRVALKEYMPSSIAGRQGPTQVAARERHQETFELGRKSFVNEARLLARFDHPSLVKVHRFWEDHGTAYMAMPFYEGSTLKDTVRGLPAPPGEAWWRDLLNPLTAALRVLHAENCLHRDIAPDNVLLLAGSQRPLLLDFGAARRVIGDATQALTVILKPGYAPVEQYAEVPGMQQGPWTDVYALGATVYWAIAGKAPVPAVGRMVQDTHRPLSEVAAGRFTRQFLQAIDAALEVQPERRTRSVDAFRQQLGFDAAPAPAARAVPQAGVAPPVPAPTIALAPTVVMVPAPAPANTPAPAPAPMQALLLAPRPARRPWAWAGGVVAVALLGTASWWWSRGQMPTAPALPATAAQPGSDDVARRAECARILHRLSLGESSPDMLEQVKRLQCE